MNDKNNSTSEHPILKIHAIGLGERGEQTLRVFFERQMGGKVQLSGEPEAAAILIDGDQYQSNTHLAAQMQAHPDRPVIFLTLTPEKARITNGIVVQKPVKASVFATQLNELTQPKPQPAAMQQFTSASNAVLEARFHRKTTASSASSHDIDSAAASLSSRERHYYVGSMPDVDLADPVDNASIYYDPKSYLQGYFSRAVALGMENGSVVRIINKSCQDILIYPFSKRVRCTAPANTLYATARLPISDNDIRIDLLPNEPHMPDTNIPTEAIDGFTWKLTLWASRGRLPQGTDLTRPVFIRSWPNLTRLLVPPHSPRILGLWSHHSYSLKDTPNILNLPQRYVFALFSACLALNLAGTTQRAADILVTPELPSVHEKRGLFRMLLNKLSLFRGSDPKTL